MTFRSRLLGIFVLVLTGVVLVSAFVGDAALKDYGRQTLNQRAEAATRATAAILESVGRGNESWALALSKDATIIANLAADDRGNLLRETADSFDALRSAGKVDQLHFHGSDRRTVLRLHRPEQFGDDVTPVRPLVRTAFEIGAPLTGIEPGLNGTAIRAIVPVLGAYGAVVGVVEVGTFVTDQMLRSIQPTGLDIQLWRENVPGVFFVSDAGRYVRLGGTNTPTAIELSPSEVTLMATAGRIVRPNPGGPGHLINVIAPLTFGGRDTGILLDICVDAGPQMELERFLALNFMWTAGLGVLCLVLAAVFGLRLVVGPIDRVADAMVSLASGRFSETVPMQERSGKLGELARAAERFRLTSVRLAEEERALRDANLKLRQANEQIMLANDAKSQILANVSHELRTPLNAILGFSDMMRSALLGPIPPRYRDYANDIHGAAEHLLGIVSDIIDLQRIETRALDLRVSTVDMHELCSSCIHLLSGLATSRGISVSLEAPSSEISILTDRQRVLQVGINLLSNAIKYSNVGSAVTVRIRADEYGCEIEVIDTGIGMTRDDIELALQPFRQVAAVRRREQDSVGLGLPIVRGLVEALGGELSIESEVGRGTRVTVKLRPLSIRAIDVNKEQFRPAPMNSTG